MLASLRKEILHHKSEYEQWITGDIVKQVNDHCDRGIYASDFGDVIGNAFCQIYDDIRGPFCSAFYNDPFYW
jgi:hypothetical protein